MVQALRYPPSPRLALVGAGVKTSALYKLARELLETPSKSSHKKAVLITATTHLADNQILLADHHFAINTPEDLERLEIQLPNGVILITGTSAGDDRVSGLNLATIDRVYKLAERQRVPLLIEVDGSRLRPIKAPAPHEPVIPQSVDTVLVSAGLSALGKPLSHEWVQHPERVSRITGLSLGDSITQDAFETLMNSSAGGLKNIPESARRIALLNQADSPQLQISANHIAKNILTSYNAIIISTLDPRIDTRTKRGKIITTNREDEVHAVHEPVAGIVLAAGGSTRMGQPKQIMNFRSKPLVRIAARTALAAGLAPVIVVTGAINNQVKAALEGLPITIAHNPDWHSGQSTSVAAGINATPTRTGSAIFLLADQPLVSESMIRKLVELHAHSLSPIVAPSINRHRSNPVLFDRDAFSDLLNLSGDIGGRALFSKHQVCWLPWVDTTSAIDIDTPDDYQRLLDI
ncbi:selenium cofactor biosynthesis protein YqeC [Chloroflexota bacterium]